MSSRLQKTLILLRIKSKALIIPTRHYAIWSLLPSDLLSYCLPSLLLPQLATLLILHMPDTLAGPLL